MSRIVKLVSLKNIAHGALVSMPIVTNRVGPFNVEHHGIFNKYKNTIVHVTRPDPKKETAILVETKVSELIRKFKINKEQIVEVSVKQAADDESKEIVSNLQKKAGKKLPLNVVFSNCQHYASLFASGIAHSPQVWKGMCWIGNTITTFGAAMFMVKRWPRLFITLALLGQLLPYLTAAIGEIWTNWNLGPDRNDLTPNVEPDMYTTSYHWFRECGRVLLTAVL